MEKDENSKKEIKKVKIISLIIICILCLIILILLLFYKKDYHKNKEEQYATRNVINNPPAPNSERYYQTNADWNSFFSVHPEFKPAGTENVTDWVSYFQQNNPEHGKLA